jgi:hypothetical protein
MGAMDGERPDAMAHSKGTPLPTPTQPDHHELTHHTPGRPSLRIHPNILSLHTQLPARAIPRRRRRPHRLRLGHGPGIVPQGPHQRVHANDRPQLCAQEPVHASDDDKGHRIRQPRLHTRHAHRERGARVRAQGRRRAVRRRAGQVPLRRFDLVSWACDSRRGCVSVLDTVPSNGGLTRACFPFVRLLRGLTWALASGPAGHSTVCSPQIISHSARE